MTRTLRKGHRGPDVRRWQEFLRAQGHLTGDITDLFDERTAAATRAFQSAHAVQVDAIVGPKTLAQASELGLRILRRLRSSELTSELIAHAKRILNAHHAAPYGSQFPFEIDGVQYVGRIEEHFHPPGGPRRPWGHHPGVSLFLDVVPDPRLDAPDEVTGISPELEPVDDPSPAIATQGIVVLDPGHGGDQRVGSSSPNNARSPSGVLEKNLTLKMAELVRAQIAEQAVNVQVELTRTSDVNVSLADRAALARQARADAFLSLHFNGFNGRARGVEALILPKASGNVNHAEDKRFAERVLSSVHRALSAIDPRTPNRGVKEQTVGVLRDSLLGNTSLDHRCRACLLEIEFLDVPEVDELFNTGPRTQEVRTSVAAAIAQALLEEIAPAPNG